jgi:hypothetical protein
MVLDQAGIFGQAFFEKVCVFDQTFFEKVCEQAFFEKVCGESNKASLIN